jgi:transcriptional regulator with XRE-family HTH domain
MKNQDDRARALDFARRLVNRRKELGYSQVEVTRRIKPLLPNGATFDRASMSRYEAGQNLPRPETLHALAAALDVSPEELLPSKLEAKDVPFKMTVDSDGMCRITLNMTVPTEVGLQIMQIVYGTRQPVEKKES